jgi:hypothetical protein
MTFGQAIAAAKDGARVTRGGWNGEGQYVYYQEGSVIKAEDCKNLILKQQAEDLGGCITISSHLDFFSASGFIVIGWLASQTDMLATDWRTV